MIRAFSKTDFNWPTFAGSNYSRAIQNQNPAKDLGQIPHIIQSVLEQQKAKETERKEIEKLWKQSQVLFSELSKIIDEYNEGIKTRNELHASLMATVNKNYDRITIEKYREVLVGFMKGHIPIVRKMYNSFWTGVNYVQIYQQKGLKDLTKFLLDWWERRFYCPSSAYKHSGHLLKGTYYYVKPFNKEKFRKRMNIAAFFRDDVVNGLNADWGVVQLVKMTDQIITENKNVERVDLLKKMKKDLEIAAKEIGQAANKLLPYVDSFESDRRSISKKLRKLEDQFKPINKNIIQLAKAHGWKNFKKESRIRYDRLPSNVLSCATLFKLFLKELKKVRVYSFLGGESDSNADLKKAKIIISQATPTKPFKYLTVYIRYTSKALIEISNFLGDDVTLHKIKNQNSIEQLFKNAIWSKFRNVGDGYVFKKYFSKWKKANKKLKDLVIHYQNEFHQGFYEKKNKATNEHRRFRKKFGAKFEQSFKEINEISRTLTVRAKAAGWQPPTIKLIDPIKRKIKIPSKEIFVKTIATVALGLASDLKGMYMYDILCGEKDMNFDIAIVKSKQAQIPPVKIFTYINKLINKSEQLMNSYKTSFKQNTKSTEEIFAQIKKDSFILAKAGKMLKEIRVLESSLQASIKALEIGISTQKYDFANKHQKMIHKIIQVKGKLLLLEKLMTIMEEHENPKQIIELSERLEQEKIKAKIIRAIQLVNKGKQVKASQITDAIAVFFRKQTKELRIALENLNQGKTASLSEQKKNSLSVSQEILENSFINLHVAQNISSESQASFLMFQSYLKLNRAVVIQLNHIGSDWIDQLGQKQRQKWARLIQIKGSKSGGQDGLMTHKTPLFTHRFPLTQGRSSSVSGYGRLSQEMIRQLYKANSFDKKPKEISRAWQRYVNILRSVNSNTE